MSPDYKKWEESTELEKIEILRRELLDSRNLIYRLIRVEKDVLRLKNHKHQESTGEVLIGLRDVYEDNLTGGIARANDPLK